MTSDGAIIGPYTTDSILNFKLIINKTMIIKLNYKDANFEIVNG